MYCEICFVCDRLIGNRGMYIITTRSSCIKSLNSVVRGLKFYNSIVVFLDRNVIAYIVIKQ